MQNAAKFSFNGVFGPLSRFDFLGKGKRLVSATWKYDQLMEQLMKKYEEKVELINGGDEGEKDVMDILMETNKDTNSELKLTRRHIKKLILRGEFFNDLNGFAECRVLLLLVFFFFFCTFLSNFYSEIFFSYASQL